MPKKIMRSLTIKELSGVDRPAQVGARALIMKRADDPEPDNNFTDEQIAELFKRGKAVLTTATDGHTHLVMLEDFDGNDVVSGTTSWQDEHTHPWIKLEDGTILIGEVDDHSHDPDRESKLAGDTAMTPEEKAKLEKAESDNAALTARLAKSDKIAKFNDATKTYFATLDEAGQDAFLEKSSDDQASAVTAYAKSLDDADAVVYTADSGDVYRKSDDPRLVAMAKQGDEDRAALAKSEKLRKRQDLEKRAADLLPNLPGTIAVRASMLEKIEDITDETERTEALAALKASNDALDPAFKSFGANNAPATVEGSPEGQLEQLATDLAKKENISHAAAYNKVLETPEGSALYDQHRAASQPN